MPPQDTGRTLFWRKLHPLSRSEKSVCLLWTQNGTQLQEPNRKAIEEEDPFKGVVSLWGLIHGSSAPGHLLPSPYPGTEATQSPLQHLFPEDTWPASSTNTRHSSCGKWRPRREKRDLLSCLWCGGKASCLGKCSFKNEKVSYAT